MNFTVYKSSAGSGKTYTLVREYLRVALQDTNPENYKKILAITFTNKAAAEMKERVFSALKGIAANANKYNSLAIELQELLKIDSKILSFKAQKVLTSMLHNYGSVAISTIDKFVYKIVSSFARDLDLPADFEVELDANLMLKQAIDLMLAKVGNQDILTKFLFDFTQSRANKEQNWNIENELMLFAKNLLNDDAMPYLKLLHELELADFLEIKNTIDGYEQHFEAQLRAIGTEALQAIEKINVPMKSYAYAGALPKFFKKLISTNLANEDFEAIKQATSIVEKNKHSSGTVDASDEQAINNIAPILNDCFAKTIEILDKGVKQYMLQSLINNSLQQLALLNEINICLAEIKKEQKLIHISEFNKLIANVVVNEPAPFIFERLGERYKYFLIDEFQDTSVTQFQNILPLIENSLAEGGFNLLVGDGKQSIYRWRGGEIEQFLMLPKLINRSTELNIAQKEKTLERNYLEKNLDTNYRSQRQIIEFNNLFFGFLKSKLPLGLQEVYNAHEQNFNPKLNQGFVQLKTFDCKDLLAQEIDEIYFSETLQKINECLSSGYKFQDIAIIVRVNRNGIKLAEFLTNNKIPIVSRESLLLKNNPIVNFLENCFVLLSQPNNSASKINIVQYLSSIKHQKFTISKLAIEELNSKNFNNIFEHFNINLSANNLLILPMYDAAEELCRVCGLVETNSNYLFAFLDNILAFSQKPGASFTMFLEWWQNNKGKLSIATPDGLNAVNIMSIHKSKGLEFPVVILPYANWVTSQGQDFMWLNINFPEIPKLKSALVATSAKLKQTEFADLYEIEKNKTVLDNVNMLYVAFTRAKQQLYIIADNPKMSKNLSKYFVDFIELVKAADGEKNMYEIGVKAPPYIKETLENEPKVMPVNFTSNNWRQNIDVL